MEVQDDEINLMDLWKVVVKRRNIIIFITLLSAGLAIAVSLKMSKVYEGEAVLALPRVANNSNNSNNFMLVANVEETKAIVDALLREVKNGNPFGGFDKELVKKVADIKIMQIKGSESQLKVVVKIKDDPQGAYEVYSKIMTYLNGNEYIKGKINSGRVALESNLSEAKSAVEKAGRMREEALHLIATKNNVGFNPLEIDVKINDLKTRVIGLETSLSMIKGYEFVSGPYVYKNKVKPKIALNILIAGMVGLFAGMLLAFVFESFEKQRTANIS